LLSWAWNLNLFTVICRRIVICNDFYWRFEKHITLSENKRPLLIDFRCLA
jgi:hypothetical protein